MSSTLAEGLAKPTGGTRNGTPGLIRFFRHEVLALASAIVILAALGMMAFAPRISPYPEEGAGLPVVSHLLLAPSSVHPFGTDDLGRDVLSRVIFGARVSVTMGVMVTLVAIAVGVPLGAASGFFGRWIDEAMMRITDVFLAFPPLLLAIVFASAMGRSFANAMLAIGISWWPWYARLVRSEVLSLREQYFVDAARSIGVKDIKIILRHILPNTLSPVIVQASMDIGSAILAGAGLSFLGLGVRPPVADWGRMLSDGRVILLSHWWVSTFPGLAIFLTVLAFNILGDALRDWFDPYMRTRRYVA